MKQKKKKGMDAKENEKGRKERKAVARSFSVRGEVRGIQKTWYYPVITRRGAEASLRRGSAALTWPVSFSLSLSSFFSLSIDGFLNCYTHLYTHRGGYFLRLATARPSEIWASMDRDGRGPLRDSGRKRERNGAVTLNVHWLRLNCFSRLLVVSDVYTYTYMRIYRYISRIIAERASTPYPR